MSKQFVNNVASVAILATYWHEVPLPPLEGNFINLRALFQHAQKPVIEFIDNASTR